MNQAGAIVHHRMERTWLDSTRDIVVDFVGWLARLDWLTTCAWLLTLGCLGCAILDSYTSLCVVGGSLAKVGSASACGDFGGWDTRLFPLAVDMGWGGALFAVLRLARTIGLKSWRWWVVLSFEALTAAFTIAGNAFHGAVSAGGVSTMSGTQLLILTCVASAVPGVTAVGSGFTLSVLVSSRLATTRDQQLALAEAIAGRHSPVEDAIPRSASPELAEYRAQAVNETAPTDDTPVPVEVTAEKIEKPPAKAATRPRDTRARLSRLLRANPDITATVAAKRLGVSPRHAARLMRQLRPGELQVVAGER